jgi:tetratricopeptide (TPR) repeat protein
MIFEVRRRYMNEGSLLVSKVKLSLVSTVLVVALGVALPRAVAAEEAETPQYRGLLSEAVAEYDARRYEEARALFRRAHDLSPNARTLRGIGMASFELREYVEALRALEGSLVEQRRPLTAPQRQQVEGLLERTRAFVGRFVPHLTPPDAILHVDGAPVALETDGTLLLSFGRHAVTAEAPGRLLETRELNVIGGERQDLVFRLRSAAVEPTGEAPSVLPSTPITTPEQPAAPPLQVTQKEPDKGGQSSAAGWFVGAGALAAGAVAGVIWWRNRASAYDQCQAVVNENNPLHVCDNLDTVGNERRFALGVTIGLAVGATALGIVGLVNLPKGDKPESKTAIACVPEIGGAHCAVRFVF